ncbi:glycerol acyltransferase [Synechococcales cyanobacterium C]|uniref:Glycerol acyltransferase n=2 Tax=Petrachloros TaxID=2918834 RepID=A0A8K2A6E1_9CYAN|nr:glycerol acyltransferase [Petrachloros mirabilis ULC683]
MPLWAWFYHHYFRVRTDGWEHVPAQGKVLFVGSHNGGLAAPDMFMFMYDWYRRFGTQRLAYGLMHPTVWKAYPGLVKLAVQGGAIVAHPKMAIAALQKNASLLVYPGGAQDVFRPHTLRHKIHFLGRKGFIKLALREHMPMMPVISAGAHDTLRVLADLYPLMQRLHQMGMPWLFDIDPEVFPIFLGLPWGIGIGPIFNFPFPTQIYTRVCPPIFFEHYGVEASRDPHYVQQCYNQVYTQMQAALDGLVAEYEAAQT